VATDPADLLRERGYRVTGQRLAVLRAVSREPHVTADAVAETVRAEIGAISIQAVYDVLGVLVDVDCAVGSAPCLTAADDMGYQIDEAEVIYWGRCAECQSQTRR